MAILSDSPTMARCPKCGSTGPNNFRLEERITLKRPDPRHPDVYNRLNSVTVYACVSCGQIVQEI